MSKKQNIPSRPEGTMVDKERVIRMVARQEIQAVATALAAQVNQIVTNGMRSAMEKQGRLVQEFNGMAFIMNALVEILIEKGVLTRAELDAKADVLAKMAMENYAKAVEAAKAKAEEEAKKPAEAKPETPVAALSASPEAVQVAMDRITAEPKQEEVPSGQPATEPSGT